MVRRRKEPASPSWCGGRVVAATWLWVCHPWVREGGARERKEMKKCACDKVRIELEISKSLEDKFVNKKWVPRKWSTSISFVMESILCFLMEVEVEVEVHFHHTTDTNWSFPLPLPLPYPSSSEPNDP